MNLYEFEKIAAKKDAPLEELIENIDIGGPTMIRAAAKNWQDVAVVTCGVRLRGDCRGVAAPSGGVLSSDTHWRLAKKAFATTAAYDRAVSARLAEIPPTGEALPADLLRRSSTFARRARWLCATARIRISRRRSMPVDSAGIAGAEQLHGKELSYNNLVDLDAAWQLIAEFDAPASAIIKHTNPCGCAEGATLAESYRRAFEADPSFGVRRSAGVQSRSSMARRLGNRQDVYRSDRRAGLYRRRARDSAKRRRICAC